MSEKRPAEQLSVTELQEVLYRKKRAQRRDRLYRLKGQGRLVEVAGLPAPNPTPPPLIRATAVPTGQMQQYTLSLDTPADATPVETLPPRRGVEWRWVFNKFLLWVEVTAVLGLLLVLLGLWQTQRELNLELAAVQRAESQQLALPTLTPTPIISVVVLPGGHKPPLEGLPPRTW